MKRSSLEHAQIELHGQLLTVYFRYYPDCPPSTYDPGEPEEYHIESLIDSSGNEMIDPELDQEGTLLEVQDALMKLRVQENYDNFNEMDDYDNSYV